MCQEVAEVVFFSEALERGSVVINNDDDQDKRIEQVFKDRKVARQHRAELFVEYRYKRCGKD